MADFRAGRSFTYQDVSTSRVAMTNETLARRLFPAGDAIGRDVWVGQRSYQVVGIVADYVNAAFQGPDRMPKLPRVAHRDLKNLLCDNTRRHGRIGQSR